MQYSTAQYTVWRLLHSQLFQRVGLSSPDSLESHPRSPAFDFTMFSCRTLGVDFSQLCKCRNMTHVVVCCALPFVMYKIIIFVVSEVKKNKNLVI